MLANEVVGRIRQSRQNVVLIDGQMISEAFGNGLERTKGEIFE